LYWHADEQYCQQRDVLHMPPVHVRKLVPDTQSHALPGRSEHVPDHVQLAEQTSCEHASQLPARVAPGVHTPAAEHAPNAPHAPQPQVPLQVRVRLLVPQPHASLSDSVVPATHAPSPAHTAAPHAQPIPHVRMLVPQRPQAPIGSLVPAAHSPLALHAPAFIQLPPRQSCCCVPQNPQGTSRGGSPSVHSHVAGAEHAPHTPLAHCSTPAPQSEAQERSASRPMPAVVSSQSSVAGTPSASTSTVASMQLPDRHSCPPVHAGVQPAVPASMSTMSGMSGVSASMGVRLPASGAPPFAHAASARLSTAPSSTADAVARRAFAAGRCVNTTSH